MVFTGVGTDTSHTAHLFYRAGCSSPAVPLNSVTPDSWQSLLMPDGGHVVSVVPGNVPPEPPHGSRLAITDIATDTTTLPPESGPNADKDGLSVSPDGSAVAYKIFTAYDDGVYVQPLNGDPAYRVSPADPVPGQNANASKNIAWSHDGKYIAWPGYDPTAGTTIVWARSDGSGWPARSRSPATCCLTARWPGPPTTGGC